MATQESMAIRRNEALATIEKAVGELLGADMPEIPRLYRDRDMLWVMQLEQIAKWVQELQEAERSIEIEKLPVADVTRGNRRK